MLTRPAWGLVVLALLLSSGCGAEPAAQPEATTKTTTQATNETSPRADTIPTRTWDEATPVGTIVAQRPATARVFELVGIDYCCGGEQTLAAAAKAHDLDVLRLLDVLTLTGAGAKLEDTRDWTRTPVGELIDHIVDEYHTPLRRELPRLSEIIATVVRVHEEEHPELPEVGAIFASVRSAIEPHLEMEETELFPAIRDPEALPAAETRALLKRFRTDHDDVGQALHKLRELTKDYEVPADACTLYTQMLQGLTELERALHAHVHLENNVLLPRALAALKDS